MTITTMSVSLASIIRDLYPSMAACRVCTNIRVSASSWEHGTTSSRLTLVSLMVVMASSPLVMITGLPVVISATLSARKWNSFVFVGAISKEALPIRGVFTCRCYSPSDGLSSFTSRLCLQARLMIHVKDDVGSLVCHAVVLDLRKNVRSGILFK